MRADDQAAAGQDIAPAPACFVFDPVGPHALLSNYAHAPFEDEGSSWRSVEHYFQAAKFADPARVEAIRSCTSADQAKSLAWSADFDSHVRSNWDEIRVEVMRRALHLKFDQHAAARAALERSWPQPIFEDSFTDAFWGIGPAGSGQNILGALLQDLRGPLIGRGDRYYVPTEMRTPGRSGGSETRSIRAKWLPTLAESGSAHSLAYDGFRALDISRALANADQEAAIDGKFEQHAALLDAKYAGYEWTDDARSAVPNWSLQFKGVIAERLNSSSNCASILAVGAGSANECANLWSEFGPMVTLVDWGYQLTRNCAREAPEATVLRRRAEALDGIADRTMDLYCSLRTYDSALIDIAQALREARRVLHPSGLAVISISDGYLTRDGEVTRGQFGTDGEIIRSASWQKMLQVTQSAEDLGFAEFSFFDIHSEIGFAAQLAG